MTFGPQFGKGMPQNQQQWGKTFRKMEHERAKDAKTVRETDFFWDLQARTADRDAKRPPKFANRMWEAEYNELFQNFGHGGSGINFAKYDDIPVERGGAMADQVRPLESFEDLQHFPMPAELAENIKRCNYVTPTPVQKHATPAALQGCDVMCCAQTGSGKTAAFLVPCLGRLDQAALGSEAPYQGPASPMAVVLAPTRELCAQIHLEARRLTYKSQVKCVSVYGGVDAKPQLRELVRSCDVLVATPGRLTDFVDRGVISFARVGTLVLDEADRMLDMGFEPQIRVIVQERDMPSCHQGRQTLMFSATFPKQIQRLARDFMRDYLWINVGRVGAAVETVTQDFLQVFTEEEKRERVMEQLQAEQNMTIIFVAMKRTASWLCRWCCSRGIAAEDIHGDKEQGERERSLMAFKRGRVQVLIGTDVASRGLDIKGVERVINYDLPSTIDDYVHRIGRTGRIGHQGYALSFFHMPSPGQSNDSGLAPDLVQTLCGSGQEVPEWLVELGGRRGKGKGKGKGKGGKGFGKGGGKGFGKGKGDYGQSNGYGHQPNGGGKPAFQHSAPNGGHQYNGANGYGYGQQQQQQQQQQPPPPPPQPQAGYLQQLPNGYGAPNGYPAAMPHPGYAAKPMYPPAQPGFNGHSGHYAAAAYAQAAHYNGHNGYIQ
jgi:ATP-dependent RNA helicase DDX3X